MNTWKLDYQQQRTPVTIAALEDTVVHLELDCNYRYVDQYRDNLSRSSFESQTAMVQFNRADSLGSIRSNLVRTPSTRSHRPSARHVVRGEGQLGDIEKEELADMLERGVSTFKPT